ncbi:hypothetical protein VNO78_05397 [Psophocarpus tetragonolobus]|uniref:Rab-GAP TBC domain-containing protein n=1 Tax=Psophocarpus tetragonolobus TaxID=3891 RepID=A0AAN9SZG0_PSOTE
MPETKRVATEVVRKVLIKGSVDSKAYVTIIAQVWKGEENLDAPSYITWLRETLMKMMRVSTVKNQAWFGSVKRNKSLEDNNKTDEFEKVERKEPQVLSLEHKDQVEEVNEKEVLRCRDYEVYKPQLKVFMLTELGGIEEEAQNKNKTWSLIDSQRPQRGKVWLCLGNFNEVLILGEKRWEWCKLSKHVDVPKSYLKGIGLTIILYWWNFTSQKKKEDQEKEKKKLYGFEKVWLNDIGGYDDIINKSRINGDNTLSDLSITNMNLHEWGLSKFGYILKKDPYSTSNPFGVKEMTSNVEEKTRSMNKRQDDERSIATPLDSRFNQTLRNVQGLLKGRSIPGKILLSRRLDLPDNANANVSSPNYKRSFSHNDAGTSDQTSGVGVEEFQSTSKPISAANVSKLKASISLGRSPAEEIRKSTMGARATDSARLMKFTKVLSGTVVILDNLRELAWSGVPDNMRPKVWRLLLGYARPNSDRTEGVLARKRLEYLDCISQYYDIPDSERSDDEVNMLRQIAVDCPRTVPEVPFFQQQQVQKSLERILYAWAIRHPASGYVQGINDLVTPFLVVFLSEYFEGGIDNWSMSDLSSDIISNIEADCYWCLSKLLDGMQDHYTFAQPGIQRLVFKLKELIRRINEPVSRHIEDQGLEFLQFAFRWFNCLLIREIPFHLITRLWDTYLAEGDALPDFLVYIFASFLLTWSDKLQKLDFQELVMFLQHLPTQNWTHQELEMVLSRAFMWHTMFNNSPSHLAS